MNAQSPSSPHHAPLTEDDVGGVHVKYLHHCHRQLWLYTRGYRPEAGSDLVAFGAAIDATTFGRKRGVTLDALRIDWVDGRLWVHEVKSAQRPDDAHAAQARLYCLALADRGVAIHGATVHYPLARRTVTVLFDDAARSSAAADRAQVVKVSRRAERPGAARTRPLHGLLLPRLLLGVAVVSEAQRTYWLTTPCRVRRESQSLVIERADGSSVHIPVTDVRDLVALAPVDVNTAAVSLLARHGIALHLLDEYGNYAGQLAPADGMCAGEVVRSQVTMAEKPAAALAVARELLLAAAHNVCWALDTSLLAEPLATLERSVQAAATGPELMAAEGTFRRAPWSLLDEQLPAWLRLQGRSRRPPRNAGNAFISFTNGIVYSRALTALRLTPLHSGVGFLHATMARHRHTLALDLAEPFKPLFAERLLRRAAHQRSLRETDFEVDVAAASLSATGRKRVVGMVRDELAETVYHRRLRRRVSDEGLIRLGALKLLRLCLEGEQYKAFRA